MNQLIFVMNLLANFIEKSFSLLKKTSEQERFKAFPELQIRKLHILNRRPNFLLDLMKIKPINEKKCFKIQNLCARSRVSCPGCLCLPW